MSSSSAPVDPVAKEEYLRNLLTKKSLKKGERRGGSVSPDRNAKKSSRKGSSRSRERGDSRRGDHRDHRKHEYSSRRSRSRSRDRRHRDEDANRKGYHRDDRKRRGRYEDHEEESGAKKDGDSRRKSTSEAVPPTSPQGGKDQVDDGPIQLVKGAEEKGDGALASGGDAKASSPERVERASSRSSSSSSGSSSASRSRSNSSDGSSTHRKSEGTSPVGKRGRWDDDDDEEEPPARAPAPAMPEDRSRKARKSLESSPQVVRSSTQSPQTASVGKDKDRAPRLDARSLEDLRKAFKKDMGGEDGGSSPRRPSDGEPSDSEVEQEQEMEESSGESEGETDHYNPLLHGCRSVDHYRKIGRLAEGAYGEVFRAENRLTKEIVTIKAVKRADGKEGFSFNALREFNILLALRHPNIVQAKEMVVGSTLDKVYMVMENLDNDLKHVLDEAALGLGLAEIKCLMEQLLRGVEYMHRNWIIHRDLKTSNILLTTRGRLAIGDFGLGRKYGSPIRPYTKEVVTRAYRCPELLLGAENPLYSTAVDMWSVGCIFGEMLMKKVMFLLDSHMDGVKDQNIVELEQLKKIFKVLGSPTQETWPEFNDFPRAALLGPQIRGYNKSQLRHFLYKEGHVTLTDATFELLNGLLALNPSKRLTAEEALEHPYFIEAPVPTSLESFPPLPMRKHT